MAYPAASILHLYAERGIPLGCTLSSAPTRSRRHREEDKQTCCLIVANMFTIVEDPAAVISSMSKFAPFPTAACERTRSHLESFFPFDVQEEVCNASLLFERWQLCKIVEDLAAVIPILSRFESSVKAPCEKMSILPLAITARRESCGVHLPALSAELTVLTREQADYIVVEAVFSSSPWVTV